MLVIYFLNNTAYFFPCLEVRIFLNTGKADKQHGITSLQLSELLVLPDFKPLE